MPIEADKEVVGRAGSRGEQLYDKIVFGNVVETSLEKLSRKSLANIVANSLGKHHLNSISEENVGNSIGKVPRKTTWKPSLADVLEKIA